MRLVLEMVRATLPEFRIVDGNFPQSPFAFCGTEAELCFFQRNIPSDAREFYAAFRQQGGVMEILPFRDAVLAAIELDRLKPPLVAFHGLDCDAASDILLAVPARLPALIIGISASDTPLSRLIASGYLGYCRARIIQGAVQEDFCFLSPSHTTQALVDSFVEVAKAVAVDLSLSSTDGSEPMDSLTVLLPQGSDHGGSSASIIPAQFVHDTSSRPEGDPGYTWLWLTDRPQIRILVGAISHRFRRLRVIVPNSVTPRNLHQARLLLNGECMLPTVESWSESSGAISIDLPQDLAVPVIVGMWVPECQEDEHGREKRYVCIDRLELMV